MTESAHDQYYPEIPPKTDQACVSESKSTWLAPKGQDCSLEPIILVASPPTILPTHADSIILFRGLNWELGKLNGNQHSILE